MKKTDIALVIGALLVIVLGCFVMKGTKAQEVSSSNLKLEGEPGLHKISYSEYQEKVDNEEVFVFIVERTTCSHCQSFMPVAEEFANENNYPMYYIDTDEMEEDDWTKLEKSNTFFKKNNGQWGTPTTMVLSGHTCLEAVEGETDKDTLKKLYKKYFKLDNK